VARRGSLVALAALVCAVAAAQDGDEPEVEGDAFWGEIAHPHRARYGELISQSAAFIQANDPGAAAALLDQAVKLDAGEPLGFYLLGIARIRTARWDGCADAFSTVERLRPGYQPSGTRLESQSVGLMLGVCYIHAARYDEAAAHYRRMLGSGEPGMPLDALHYALGDCDQALGRLDEAIEEYALASAASPKNAPPLFALAVALDRDEQIARAHDAMARALALDPQLGTFNTRSIFFAPPDDVHYYLGLASQLLAASDPLRRAPAIVRFRRYLAAAGQGPWAKRARAHLAELGPSSLGPADVLVSPVDAPERDAAVKAIVALGPELQRCMEGDRDGALRTALHLSPSTKNAKQAPPRSTPVGLLRPLSLGPEAERVTTSPLDSEPVSRQAIECIDKTLRGVKLTVRQLTLVQVAVIARSP